MTKWMKRGSERLREGGRMEEGEKEEKEGKKGEGEKRKEARET